MTDTDASSQRGPLGHECDLPNIDICQECLIEVLHPTKGERFFKKLAAGKIECRKFMRQQNDDYTPCDTCQQQGQACTTVQYKDGLDVARLFLAVALQAQVDSYRGEVTQAGTTMVLNARMALHALLVEIYGITGGAGSWVQRDWGRMTIEGALRVASYQGQGLVFQVRQLDIDNAHRLEWLQPDTLPADEL